MKRNLKKKNNRNNWKRHGLFKEIAKLLWPEVCPFCGKVNASGPCSGCIFELKLLKPGGARCFCCGKPVKSLEQEFCRDCRKTARAFEAGRSLWIHKSPVKEGIYQFKYHNLRTSGFFFARVLSSRYERLLREWNPDLIIPIPLHSKRKRKRGYNQALILATCLGSILSIPVDSENLIRTQETAPQKKLDHGKRRENLRKAFALKENFQPVPTVLLVDDIYTTGNTLDIVASLLKKRGVEKVYFLTISIGSGDS